MSSDYKKQAPKDISDTDGDWDIVMDVLPDEGFVEMKALVQTLSSEKKNNWTPERAQLAVDNLILEQELLPTADRKLVGLNNQLNREKLAAKNKRS